MTYWPPPKLPARTRVEVFEKDGYETISGTVLGYEGNCILIGYKNANESGTLKIPCPRVEIRLTTRGNDLEQYKVKHENLH